jgi:predicted aspartyl protease
MKNKISFCYNPKKEIIHIPGKIWGPTKNQNLTLVFDPGASRTIIDPTITDAVGYQATGIHKRVTTSSVIGFEEGYTLTVKKLTILDFEFENIEVCCFDLPENSQIDGLIGLDILEKFEVTLRHRDHWIQFERLV